MLLLGIICFVLVCVLGWYGMEMSKIKRELQDYKKENKELSLNDISDLEALLKSIETGDFSIVQKPKQTFAGKIIELVSMKEGHKIDNIKFEQEILKIEAEIRTEILLIRSFIDNNE